ncbi:unnamed protein product [Malus baccata var. baccata]
MVIKAERDVLFNCPVSEDLQPINQQKQGCRLAALTGRGKKIHKQQACCCNAGQSKSPARLASDEVARIGAVGPIMKNACIQAW